jgi:hypothetical protein
MFAIGSIEKIELPRCLTYARNFSFVGKFAEANAAQIEVAHIAMLATASETATNYPRLELGFLL